MKKIFISLMSLLVLASCSMGPGIQEVDKTIGESGRKQSYQTNLETTSNKIKNTKEFADCMQPAVSMCISTVGMQLAQRAKSIEFCNELNSPDQRDGCRFAVVMGNVAEKNDPNLCNTLSGSYITQCMDSTYGSQAIAAKDPSLCERLKETSSVNDASGNTLITTSSGKKNQCIFSVILADTRTTPADCKKIEDLSLQEICTTSVKNRIPPPKAPITK